MTATLEDKITIILKAQGLEKTVISVEYLNVRDVARVCAQVITVGKAKMENFDSTSFYRDVMNRLSKFLDENLYKVTASKLNPVAISATRILRNEQTVSTYAELERVIEGTYAAATQNYTQKADDRADDDISDLLDSELVDVPPRKTDMVPEVDPVFKEWGDYGLIEDIIGSGIFMPVMISGLSGNGKSVMVEQACAKLNREYVRVQMTPETDSHELIGGFQISEGSTFFEKGPVIKAMEAGAILLIDELDRSSNKIMELQGIMEGKPILIKKTGELVKPAPGFNIIATANTKGQGDETGKFSAATILDEAFLERFTMVIEQHFPPAEVESRILAAHMVKYGAPRSRKAIRELVRWANVTRDNFNKATQDEYISTRRLCHIMQIYAVVRDLKRAVELGVSRYDVHTKRSLIEMFGLL